MDKSVEVQDLSELLKVSAVTIRKDLRFLEHKGLLFRTHGGASLDNPYINEKPIDVKEKILVDEKHKIAKAANKQIIENDSILIASGTTVLALAKVIETKGKLTVITSALNVALELSKHKGIDVLQLGGFLRANSSSVTGDYAIQVLEEVSCSKLFLGVDGIDLDYGITTSDLEEAKLNQKMLCSVQRTIVLSDSSKFGKRSLAKICDLHFIDEIITDKGLSKTTKDKLIEMNIQVTLV